MNITRNRSIASGLRVAAITALLGVAALLSGCATPLGQEYGTAGGVGGAIIGGATGGLRGAVIGGAAGAIVGGVVGDQQSLHNGNPGYYREYPRQCWDERVPYYDRFGYVVGYGHRRVCR